MAEREISVHIEKKFEGWLDKSWLESVVCQTLDVEGIVSPVEVSLDITDDEIVRQLNRDYRGRDEFTDVLAFSLFSGEAGGSEPVFVAPPDGILHLGEVIISYPQAAQQAAELGHPVGEEIALLTIHGVLHLLGYDDEQPEEERQMRAKEKEILDKIGIHGVM